MYGYIYMTINKISGEVYIGQHKTDKFFDENYYGSGKILRERIDEYGIYNFEVYVLYYATTEEDLNRAEIEYIAYYKSLMGDLCINMALGGVGGASVKYADLETKAKFVEKMTKINRERCGTEEFRKFCSERNKERYSDPKEREKQSIVVREAWADEELRQKQSETLKEYYKHHKKDNSYNYKPCQLILGNNTYTFDSVAQLKKFMDEELDYRPSNPRVHRLLESEKPIIPFHKNKNSNIDGMVLKYIIETVETNGDECNHVGQR